MKLYTPYVFEFCNMFHLTVCVSCVAPTHLCIESYSFINVFLIIK